MRLTLNQKPFAEGPLRAAREAKMDLVEGGAWPVASLESRLTGCFIL
jgi:hypothetical protein